MPGYLLIEEKMLKPFRSKGFEALGGRRITLRPIFGSPMKNSDPSGNEYYQAGFNLT